MDKQELGINQQIDRYKTDEGYIKGFQGQVDSSVIIYQLSTDDILEDLEMNLRGFDWDADKGKFEKKRERILNDKCASILMTLVKIEVNKTKILSYFEDEDIRIICEEFENNIIDILASKYREWEIDIHYLSCIRAMLGNAVYSTYMRALKGGEKTFLKGTERRIETYAERDAQRKGILASLGIGKSKW
jgi:hypothetical protein